MLGQVTRVYPLSAEVTLLTDKDARDPGAQQPHRSARSAAFGGARRRRPARAALHGRQRRRAGRRPAARPRGVDGIYPPGLPVAKVANDRPQAPIPAFARIAARAAGRVADGVRHVLVLEPIGAAAAAAAGARRPEAAPAPRARKRGASEEGAAHMIMPRRADQLLLPVNPLVHLAARCSSRSLLNMRAARPACRRCPTSWRSCWCSGTCTSRAASASASPSSSAC